MKKLLELLQDNCKISTQDLASMLNIPLEEVETQIRELEANKTIIKYHTFINWEKAGDESVAALIDVKVTPQRGVGFDQVAERIYRFPEVKSVFLMSGGYDLSVLVEGKTMKEVALFVAIKLATIEDVQSTTTHFVLKKYKQEGVILEDQEADHRLVISP